MMNREAFLSQAAHAAHNMCVLWPYAVRKSSGYGAHNLPRPMGKKNVDAHVRACSIAHGERPTAKHEVAHSCGEKLCCNGNHLRWATHGENMADAVAGGKLKGGGRYRQRLFAEEVNEIRTSSLSLVELGERFGVDPAYVGRVRRAA